MFGVGLGWSLGYVALAIRLTAIPEAGRRRALQARNDLISQAAGGAGALLSGFVLRAAGLSPLVIAFAAGLLLAVGVAYLLDYLDQSIKSDEELTERLGLIAIGHVAFAPAAKGRRAELLALDSRSPASEAYKALRTSLLFSTIDQEFKTLVITSAGPGEGKSRTAANLAVVLAGAGHKTLLIDADFRRPSQHKIFSRVRNIGLSNLILHDVAESEAIVAVEQVPNLWLAGTGPIPPNPSELLGSGRMRELTARLRTAFTYVIIDTPPVNAVTDAAILASVANLTILVVEQGRTTFPALGHAKQMLDRVGANTIGVVMNKVLESKDQNHGYDARLDRYVDMVKEGIIDPTKVVRSALQNAASVATLLLTSEALIADAPKKDEKPAGGGMEDMY